MFFCSKVMFWQMSAATIAPFVAGAVIKDPEEGSGGFENSSIYFLKSVLCQIYIDEVDYQLAYYICDGFFVLACLVCLKLDVSMEKSGDKV